MWQKKAALIRAGNFIVDPDHIIAAQLLETGDGDPLLIVYVRPAQEFRIEGTDATEAWSALCEAVPDCVKRSTR